MAAKRKIQQRPRKHQTHSASPLLLLGILVVIVLLGTSIYMLASNKPEHTTYAPYPLEQYTDSFDFGNSRIMLNNEELQFTNGSYQASDPSQGPHTAMFTNKSVNSAGTHAAAILIDNPGGSGTFYYVVGGMLSDGKDVYSTPVFLGDRIKVESIEVTDPTEDSAATVTVTYLDRPTGAPMSADPNQSITVTYTFDENGMLNPVMTQ